MMKRVVALWMTWAMLGISPLAGPQSPAATSRQGGTARSDFFPVSVWYSGGKARAPMLELVTSDSAGVWKQDIEKIKDLGFNTVRTWVEWTANEPRPGEYHFEQLELLLRLAEEAGLKVIVQVYVDSAPDWAGDKFPDARFVAQSGDVITSQAAPGYCFDHSGVREAVLNFYREVAKRVAQSPAFFGWDLWSEPHVINWAVIDYIPNASFCYCPYSTARFRSWLQKKYNALEQLNRAWYRAFREWKEVEPPRFGTILSYADYLDWRTFITEKLAEDLAARNRAVKEITPNRVTTSHAAVPSVFTTPAAGDGTPDDWLMHQSVDYYGTSFYPKHSFPATHWSLTRRALAMDFAAAAGGDKGFYVGELQGGFGVRGVVVGDEITADETALYTWGMISRGAKAINYYAFYPMSSGYESGGYGLIQLDGTLTERSRRAGAAAQKIAANAEFLLRAGRQPAEAALLFNRMATMVGGHQHSGERTAVRDSAAGYHRMFLERNLPLDFLHPRWLDPQKLAQYKLIIVPYPILLTESIVGALKEYVAGGGHLFVEARPGWVDERGYAQPVIPGFGLHEVFGVREKSVRPRGDFRVRWGEAEIPAATFEERFEVIDQAAKPVAFFEDGSPAAYQRRHGKGSALVLGAFAGQINETKPAAMNPLGGILARWAGLEAPALSSSSPVELRILTAGSGRMIFLFNHGGEAAHVKYTLDLKEPVAGVRELVSGEAVAAPRAAQFEIELTLPPRSVRVYRVDFSGTPGN